MFFEKSAALDDYRISHKAVEARDELRLKLKKAQDENDRRLDKYIEQGVKDSQGSN